MKKSLIPLAAMAMAMPSLASAQSTVTLYGLLDLYVGSVKVAAGPDSTRNSVVNSGGFQTSRFGFKGSEDLGGGLRANFLLEGGFALDTGALDSASANAAGLTTSTNIFSRQSYVGFSGGLGEVRVGKIWTAYDDQVGSGLAAFNANAFVPSANVWVSSIAYNGNPGNTVYYATPDFGGFTAAASYALGENKTATSSAGKIASFNVAYTGGPVFVGLAYQSEKADGAAQTAKFTELNGSYDFGPAKLLAAYGNVKDFGGVPKTSEYQIGVDVPVTGAFTVSAGYARSKDQNNAPAAEVTRKGIGVAGLYTMSKRTNLYVGAQNNKSSDPSIGKGHQYGVGIRHLF